MSGARGRVIVPVRVLLVTGGLILTGIVVGAICGGIAIGLVMLAGTDWAGLFDWEAYFLAGFFGAVIGAVTAPLLGWLLLRRVPLGRAILLTAVGTILGGAGGWRLPAGPLVAAFMGCTVAAVSLFVSSRRTAAMLPIGREFPGASNQGSGPEGQEGGKAQPSDCDHRR